MKEEKNLYTCFCRHKGRYGLIENIEEILEFVTQYTDISIKAVEIDSSKFTTKTLKELLEVTEWN